jgi:hypothetical protein
MNFSLGHKTNHENHFSIGNKVDTLKNFIGHKFDLAKNKNLNLPIIDKSKVGINNDFNNVENNEPKTFDYNKHINKNNNSDNRNSNIEKHKKSHKKDDKNKNYV